MLLTLDLATQTGWAAGVGDVLPDVGSFRMPDTKDEVGPFLDFYFRWLSMKVEEVQPTMIVFEAPVLPQARFDRESNRLIAAPTSMATTRKLQGLAGVTEMVAYRAKIDVREAYGATVKKALTGSGKAQKPDMMAYAKKCGMDPKNFDEADAFGVFLVAVKHYAPVWFPTWQARLFGNPAL